MKKKPPAAKRPVKAPDSPSKKTSQKSRQPLTIVGIGASAGGLEAFEQFFKHVAPDPGMAFILVPHLDPDHVSMLPELLGRFTRMEVLNAADGVKVAPNQVYVITPNRDMAIFHGSLQLTQPERTRGLRMPIDYFFRSLAEDRGENAICIILSGTGTDGSMGLRSVHGAGGKKSAAIDRRFENGRGLGNRRSGRGSS